MRALLLATGSIVFCAAVYGQTCTAEFGNQEIRLEGIAERTGDILVSCTGGVPTPVAQSIPQLTVTVSFTMPVTSRVISGAHTEALAVLDGDTAGGLFACTTVAGTCPNQGGTPYGAGAGQNRNVFRTTAIAASQLQWIIPFDPPGPGVFRVIRLTNLRVNPTALGPVQATVAAGALNIPNSTQTIATVSNAMGRSVRDPANTAVAPAGGNAINTAAAGVRVRVGTLRFSELIFNGFHQRTLAVGANPDVDPTPQEQIGDIDRNETGFFFNAIDNAFGTPHGLADHGTRFRATFSNIPAGVQLYVGLYNDNQNLNWLRSIAADASCAGPFSATAASFNTPAPMLELSITGGQATACWQVMRMALDSINDLDVGVYASYPANFNAPAFNVRMELAPVSTVNGPGSLATPLPRFKPDATTTNVALFQGGPAPFTCIAQAASTPAVRLEGIAEPVGDVVLNCTGGTPTSAGNAIPQFDVALTFSTTVTSRVVSGAHTEALLVLDEGQSGFFPCTVPGGICTGTGAAAYGSGAGQNRNVFRTTTLQGANGLVWQSLPLDPPGASGTRIIRLTNLRVNPAGIGNIVATVSINGSNPPAVSNPNPVVGIGQAALAAAVRTADNTAPAPTGGNPVNTALAGTNVRIATLRFGELFPSVFRPRTIAPAPNPDTQPPPQNQNNFVPPTSETIFYDAATATQLGGTHGLADHGTRVRAVFTGLPSGAQFFVGIYNDNHLATNEWLRAVACDANGAGGFSAIPPTVPGPPALVQLSIVGGSAVACWEVLRTDPTLLNNLDIGVYASYPAGFTAPAFAARLELAPLSTVAGASTTAPLPRFEENTTTRNVATFAVGAAVPLSCTAQATPIPVRAQGLSEKVADVVVSCTGGTPTAAGQTLPQFNLQVSTVPGANMTPRILGAGTANYTETLLLLDEPQPFEQFVCEQPGNVCGGFGNGIGSGYYGGGVQSANTPNNRNVYQGVLVTANSILFQGIPFDPPGANATRRFRIANVKVNATQVTGGALALVISTTGTPGGVQISNPTQTVGTVSNAVATLVRDVNGAIAPSGIDVPTTQAGTSVRLGTIRFSENQPAAFLQRTNFTSADPDAAPPVGPQNTPGQTFGSETGFFNPAFPSIAPRGNLGVAGLADQATRLRAVFSDLPNGVTLQAGIYNETGQALPNATELIRLIGTGADGSGPFTPVAGTANLAQLPLVGTTATAVWEVLRSNAGVQGNFDIAVFATFPAGVSGGVRVRMDLAPVSTNGFAALADPQPRFAGGVTQSFANFGDFKPEPPPRPSLNVAPVRMTFTAPVGGSAPPQTVRVEGQVTELEFGTFWGNRFPMRIDPGSGVTPRTLTLTPSAGNLGVGTYSDFLQISAPLATNNPVLVEIVLTVVGQLRLISLSPPSIAPGGSGFQLNATGENVPANSVLLWNNEPLPTRTQGNQLNADVPARLYASPGQASVAIRAPDGTVSNSLPFTIGRIEITSIAPDRVTATRSAFDLTINGTGFVPGSTVQSGQTSLAPSSGTATQLIVRIPASLVAQPGQVPIKVVNPGGAMSNEVNLRVTAAPVITQLDPAFVIADAGAFRITVLGRNFTNGSTVNISGRALTTSFADEGRMTADVPADVLAGRDAGSVTVVTADGVSSNAANLPVRPRPVVSGNPSIQAGDTGATIVLTGSGFTQGTTVECRPGGGAPITVQPSEITDTTIRVTLPAACVAGEGNTNLRVVPPNGPASGDIPVTILPPPRIVRLGRPSVDVGGGAQQISVEGTGFLPGATLLIGGTAIPTELNQGQLQGTIPPALLARPGTANVQVRGPGGSLSNVATLQLAAPALPSATLGAPATSASRQQFSVPIQPGPAYPLALTGTLTLTFLPDGTSPDDPAIVFANGSRTFTFNLAAGQNTPPTAPQVQTGSTAGAIVLTLRYTLTQDPGATPANTAEQRVTIARAVPSITTVECTRRTGGLTVVTNGLSNTRELRQGIFDFQASTGETLSGANFTVDVTRQSEGYFVRSTPGGLFRYEQDFSIQGGASTAITSVSVSLINSVGRSEARTAQCQ